MGETARTIRVGALARVEGEGAFHVRIRNGRVIESRFRIFEPPRFFEALLKGRMFSEAPEITSRICGICPVAYIMSACQAMEDALGLRISPAIRDLRRLAYCGEWIQSHVLHATMLHAPDFLGMADFFAFARRHPEIAVKALRLKKVGNDILEAIGGRAVHPVNLRVGGFYRAPSAPSIRALGERLEWGADAAVELARFFASFDFPDHAGDYLFVSLQDPEAYAVDAGQVVSDRGLAIEVRDFLGHFEEEHVRHSTALHGRTATGETYLVGPLARYANNFERLSARARALAAEIGLGPVCRNPFKSILVRMVEVVHALDEAHRLALAYEEPERSWLEASLRAGEGHGATEAPRGLLYHRYRVDEEGRIVQATIIPPTSQNQRQIEADLRGVVERSLDLADEDLQWRCEQTIRNHDPCISCATHFLDLRIERA